MKRDRFGRRIDRQGYVWLMCAGCGAGPFCWFPDGQPYVCGACIKAGIYGASTYSQGGH